MLLEERIHDTNLENKQLANFFNPGTCYLKLMMYWADEKTQGLKENSIDVWEAFVRKYFDENVTMIINIFEGDKLFNKISNPN
jgi:hypothetical protein